MVLVLVLVAMMAPLPASEPPSLTWVHDSALGRGGLRGTADGWRIGAVRVSDARFTIWWTGWYRRPLWTLRLGALRRGDWSLSEVVVAPDAAGGWGVSGELAYHGEDGRLRAALHGRLLPRAGGGVALRGRLEAQTALWYGGVPLGRPVAPAAGARLARAFEAVAWELPLAVAGGVALPTTRDWPAVHLDVAVETVNGALIRNDLLAAVLEARLRLQGTLAQPALAGEVTAVDGEVRLAVGTFLDIERAWLSLPDRPGGEPVMAFVGRADLGRLGVRVRLQGPVAAPLWTVSGDGPVAYSQEELLALLVFGHLPGERSGGEEQRQELMSQALRLAGRWAADRPPEIDGGGGVFTEGWLVDIGEREDGTADPLPIASRGGPSATAFTVEKQLGERWSVISRIDYDNQPSADLQYRRRFGGDRAVERTIAVARSAFPDYLERLDYRGNRSMDRAQLDQVLARPRLGPDPLVWTVAVLADAAYRIEQAYRRRGHDGVRVAAGPVVDGRALLFIDEGRRRQQATVELHWQRAEAAPADPPDDQDDDAWILDTERLVRQVAATGGEITRSLRQRVALQAQAAVALLRAQGFRDAQVLDSRLVETAATDRLTVIHELVAGPRYRWGRVVWESEVSILSADLVDRAAALRDQVWDSEAVDALLAAARQALRRRGHLSADAHAETTADSERHRVEGRLRIDPGPVYRAVELRLEGLRRVDAGFVRRFIGLRSGQLLDGDRLRLIQRRLLATGLFASVTLEPVETEESNAVAGERQTTVVAHFLEREPYEARVRLGYGVVDDLRFGVDAIWRSPMGGPETLRIGGEINHRHRRLDASLTIPGLFAQPWLTARVEPFWQRSENRRPRYDEEWRGVTAATAFRLAKPVQVGLGMMVVRFEDHRGDRVEHLNAPFVEGSLDLRDSPFAPRRGLRLALRHEATGADLGSTLSYGRSRLLGAGYVPLGERLVLAVGGEGGLITTGSGTDSEDLPRSFRFAAGGAFSVRGFEEGSLAPRDPVTGEPSAGDALLVLRWELRLRLTDRYWYGVVFNDWGNAFASWRAVRLDDLRPGFGYGLRYLSPAGTVSLDVGFNPDPEADEEQLHIHLSLGMPF